MIAADSNVWIYFFNDTHVEYAGVLASALKRSQIAIPPVVISELLSFSLLTNRQKIIIKDVHFLEPDRLFWERAGIMRAQLLQRGYKTKLPDTLIAQSCIDHDVPLLTRDAGFEAFAAHAGLRLVQV
ncbi:MAG: PIN domain-containing protein [Bdellovibrionales bacterium]